MTPAELQAQMKMLEPYKEVHDNPHVQKWVEEMNATLEAINDAILRGNYSSKEMQSHLAMMGIEPPETPEQELLLYKAFHLMLGFLRRKLSLLETQSENYEKTRKKIIELRNRDIGSNRSVPTR